MRRHPRFITNSQVELNVGGRNALRPVWMRDISKGGLFIETEDPPPLRSQISVRIQTPDGEIELSAEVVHVRAHEESEKTGVGVQFVDLCPKKRCAIENYVEGLAARLSSGSSSAVVRVSEASLSKAVQEFLRAFEREEVYAALDVEPDASAAAIKDRVSSLRQVFQVEGRTLSPALATRISHVLTLLKRIESLMLDDARRLDYDLRHGHVRAEARLRFASPEECAALRKRWSQIHPDLMQKAELLTAQAVSFVQKLDYDQAIPPAVEALDNDPFNIELRQALKTWRKVLATRNGPRPMILSRQPA